MDRRQFLRLLGIAPIAAAAIKLGIKPRRKAVAPNVTQIHQDPVAFVHPTVKKDIARWYEAEQAARLVDQQNFVMISTRPTNNDLYAKIWDDVHG